MCDIAYRQAPYSVGWYVFYDNERIMGPLSEADAKEAAKIIGEMRIGKVEVKR